jgi:hypothetical protein
MGRYLYAVIAGSADRAYGAIGIDGAIAYVISDGEISAVVSNVPNGKIRPERRNLGSHQAVLRRLIEETTPLPVSFGIIADGPAAVKRILSQNRQVLCGELERTAGKVEMGLRVTWNVPNIFDYFVYTHPDLRVARDLYVRALRGPTQEDKIELGRMFERTLNEDREQYTATVEEILEACCSEIKSNRPRNEREVMNLACLVVRGREMEERFERGVLEAARAPHSFVNIDLEL